MIWNWIRISFTTFRSSHHISAADQTTINAKINVTKSSHLDPEPDDNELGSSWALFTTPTAAECYIRPANGLHDLQDVSKTFNIYSAFKQSMKEFHCQMCKYWSKCKEANAIFAIFLLFLLYPYDVRSKYNTRKSVLLSANAAISKGFEFNTY